MAKIKVSITENGSADYDDTSYYNHTVKIGEESFDTALDDRSGFDYSQDEVNEYLQKIGRDMNIDELFNLYNEHLENGGEEDNFEI